MKLHTEQIEVATESCGAIKLPRDRMKSHKRTTLPPNRILVPEFSIWLIVNTLHGPKLCVSSYSHPYSATPSLFQPHLCFLIIPPCSSHSCIPKLSYCIDSHLHSMVLMWNTPDSLCGTVLRLARVIMCEPWNKLHGCISLITDSLAGSAFLRSVGKYFACYRKKPSASTFRTFHNRPITFSECTCRGVHLSLSNLEGGCWF